MVKLPLPTPLAVGTTVTWYERTRERQGVVEEVYESPGWPSEYGVRPTRLDGTPSVTLRRFHHSELNPPAPGESDVLAPEQVRARIAEIQQQIRRR